MTWAAATALYATCAVITVLTADTIPRHMPEQKPRRELYITLSLLFWPIHFILDITPEPKHLKE